MSLNDKNETLTNHFALENKLRSELKEGDQIPMVSVVSHGRRDALFVSFGWSLVSESQDSVFTTNLLLTTLLPYSNLHDLPVIPFNLSPICSTLSSDPLYYYAMSLISQREFPISVH